MDKTVMEQTDEDFKNSKEIVLTLMEAQSLLNFINRNHYILDINEELVLRMMKRELIFIVNELKE